ncbi:MAG: winged helix-turn-helix domain-containing protein [Candidatus Moraniibacteriota bacterium]
MARAGSKTYKQLERYFKGVANHRRISILQLVSRSEGITLDDMSRRLECNLKTISEHTRRLVQAGLLNKTYQGRTVAHSLSPYGKKMLSCLKIFQHS